MKKILSVIVAALVSVSFAGIVSAADPMMKDEMKPAVKKKVMKPKKAKKAMKETKEMKEMAPAAPMAAPAAK